MYSPIEYFYNNTDEELLKPMWDQFPQLYGLPEIWKPITKAIVPNVIQDKYFVSTYGRVFSTIRNVFLSPVETANGYFRVFLRHDESDKGLYYLLHRIVLMTFYPIPDADSMQVNHKDGIKSHNWYWNLEWNTSLENIHHAINTGLRKQNGEDNVNHIITNEIADTIGYLLSTTSMTAQEIAFHVGGGATERIVYNILAGTAWKDIYEKYNLAAVKKNPKVLTDDQVHLICKYYESYRKSNPIKQFGERSFLMQNALKSSGIEINSSTMRSAERLYYKLIHKEICDKYNY